MFLPPFVFCGVLFVAFLPCNDSLFIFVQSVKCRVCHSLGQGEGRADIALPGENPTSVLWDVTCHMGSHSVTCHRRTCQGGCSPPDLDKS